VLLNLLALPLPIIIVRLPILPSVEPGLPLGSQILAVADIFTALNEERTYRPALERNKIFNIMYKMARERAINGDLVRLLEKNYELVNETRKISQRESAKEYAVMNPFFTG